MAMFCYAASEPCMCMAQPLMGSLALWCLTVPFVGMQADDAAAAVPQAWTIRIQHGLLAQLNGLQHLLAQLYAWCAAFSWGCLYVAEELLGPRFSRPRTVILVLLASSAGFGSVRARYTCK